MRHDTIVNAIVLKTCECGIGVCVQPFFAFVGVSHKVTVTKTHCIDLVSQTFRWAVDHRNCLWMRDLKPKQNVCSYLSAAISQQIFWNCQ